MFGTRKVRSQPSPYAMKNDFCRVFNKNMNHLYLLSFLLTGDHTIAEQCFVGGLHSAQQGSQVFKEWAESWARRMIIQNAIRLIRPWRTTDANHLMEVSGTGDALTEHAEIAGIVNLPPFERFVFVMSVLERYSDQDCSFLLGCTRSAVAEARTRAHERLAKFADPHRKLVSIGSYQKTRPDDPGLEPQSVSIPTLAASA